MDNLQEKFSKLSLQDLDFSKVRAYHHSKCILHKSSRNHPEQPNRIQSILKALKKYPHLSIIDIQNQQSHISQKEVENLAVELQGGRYVQFVQQMWDQMSKRTEMYINTDTYYGKHTYESAIAAAITSIQAIKAATSPPYPYTFAIVRPPGHHSGLKSQPHGFSFLNNVGLASKFLLSTKNTKKIAIIDWDVHHGQGTQNLFYKIKEVLYISLHRFDKGKYFPHIPQSSSENIGEEAGIGYNINLCWDLPQKAPGSARQANQTVGDDEYMYAFRKLILPILRQYDPDVILISCGFDSAEGDVIGGLRITRTGYQFMLNQLLLLGKPVSLVLEGGYNTEVLQWASQAVVQVLADKSKKSNNSKSENMIQLSAQCNQIGRLGIERCMKTISPYWRCLQ